MNPAVRIIIFVVVMGTVSAGLLVGINAYTAPLIARNEELKLKSSVLAVLELPHTTADTIKVFDESVEIMNRDKYTFYTAADGSVAFEFAGPGLWGPVSGIISMEKDLKTIRTIVITHQEETPGLGGRIAEKDYLKQFRAKEVSPRLNFMPEGKAVRKNEVDAITGATGSSRALEKLLNDTLKTRLGALRR